MSRRTIAVADLFCGAGGSSTGAQRALRRLGLKMDLLCINHWPVAIDQGRLVEARRWLADQREHIASHDAHRERLVRRETEILDEIASLENAIPQLGGAVAPAATEPT